MKSLSGRTALVTGASRGIGRAIAMHLAGEGANVVLTARDSDLLEANVDTIRADGGSAAAVAGDLRDAATLDQVARSSAAAYGGLDILVNNAGATKRGEFTDLTDADWQDGFALKFFGAVRLTRALWPFLRHSRGSVIFIAGSGGRTPGAQFTIGGSVNAALLSFTKAMAEVGLRDGVQVNCVNPGPVRTARLATRLTKMTEQDFLSQEKIARIAEPEEIAALVGFIVGPQGRSLHGSLIDIDGGSTKTI